MNNIDKIVKKVRKNFKTKSDVEKFAFLNRVIDYFKIPKSITKQPEAKIAFDKYMAGDFNAIFDFCKIAGKKLDGIIIYVLTTDPYSGEDIF